MSANLFEQSIFDEMFMHERHIYYLAIGDVRTKLDTTNLTCVRFGTLSGSSQLYAFITNSELAQFIVIATRTKRNSLSLLNVTRIFQFTRLFFRLLTSLFFCSLV